MSISIYARGADAAEIRIDGPIGETWAGDGLTSRRFADELSKHRAATRLTVRMNSPGGAVFDGIAIYNQLVSHGARVEVIVEGLAASIASVIAMAGDSIRMGEGALMMVHNPWTLAMGDAETMRETADLLDQVRDSLLGIYAGRTGLPPDEIRSMMDAETWLDGATAVEKRFADAAASEPDARAAAGVHRDHRATFDSWRAQLASTSRRLQPAAILQLARELTMDPNNSQPAAAGTDVLALEVERRRQVRDVFAGDFAQKYRDVLDACLDDPRCTPAQASKKLLAQLAEANREIFPIAGNSLPFESIAGSHRAVRDVGDFAAAATDALLQRAGIVVDKPHPAARDLRATSLADIASMVLSQRGQRSHGSPAQRISAALTTSDYPELLRNTAGKALAIAYEAEPASHRQWVRPSSAPNFREQSRIGLGAGPDLLLTPEGANYQYASFGEQVERFVIDTYGRMMRITRQALVNDDLQGFTLIPRMFGQSARRREADLVYALLTANANAGKTMADGQPLFHSTHSNIATGTGLNATTLASARQLLRRQTGVEGVGLLNLQPRYLIVPAEAEFTAEVLLAQATRVTDTTLTGGRTTGTQASPVPQWVSSLTLVVEPRLSAGFAYVASGQPQIDTVEMALLDGAEGPVIDDEIDFKSDALEMKARHDVGATFVDWRGIVRIALT